MITLLSSIAPRNARTLFWLYIIDESILKKIFDEEIQIRVRQSTFLQMFGEFMLNMKVIFKSNIGIQA